MRMHDEAPPIIFKFQECEYSPPIIFELVAEDAEGRAAALADFDSDVASRAAFADDDAERWAHAPDDPEQCLREFYDAAEPDKPNSGGRRLAWQDFCFKRAVLLVNLIYDGKQGRQKVSQESAIKMWRALRPATAKDRDFTRIFSHRDSGHEPNAWSTREKSRGKPPYMTRADLLKMLVDMIRDDEQRLEARRAKAHAESPGR